MSTSSTTKTSKMEKRLLQTTFWPKVVPQSTIYRHIRSRESGKQIERKKGSGRIPLINTSKKRSRIAKMFNHKVKGSLRQAAKKFNCSHETIRVIIHILVILHTPLIKDEEADFKL